LQFTERVAGVMDRHRVVAHPDLEQVLEADAWARKAVEKG
jgi:hypothetical protein